MKAIIFDLDDTLIMWKPEFINALGSVLKDLGYDISDAKLEEINELIETHEFHYDNLTKENFLEYLNNNLDIKLTMEFVDKLILYQGNLYYMDESVNNTLEYLSKKYDLYVITNWFTEIQKKRLENMGILKYFKKVIGADQNYYKPNTKVFDIILKDYDASECLSIGDTLENDILLPMSLGMKAIWKTNKNDTRYETIKNISDLMNIL